MIEKLIVGLGGIFSPIKTYLYALIAAVSAIFIIWFNILRKQNKEQEQEISNLHRDIEEIKVNNEIKIETEVFNAKQEVIKQNIDKKILKENIKKSEVKDEETDSKLTFII